MTHTITIPDWIPPTLNSVSRVKIRQGIKTSMDCHKFVATYALKQQIPKARSARSVRVTIVFPPNRKRPDPDNLSKVLLDSLKCARLLIDDSWEYVIWEPPVYFIGERTETRIELTDIPVRVVERIETP